MDPLSDSPPGGGGAEGQRPDGLAAVAGRVRSGSRVLVAGAAIGDLCRQLKQKRRCEVDGYELDARLAESAAPWCRQLLAGSPEGLLADAGAAEQTYDAVVCHGLFERLQAPEPVLARLKAALRPKGALIAAIPNAAYAGMAACLANGDFRGGEASPDGAAPRMYTLKSFIGLLESQGWEVGPVDARRLPVAASEYADCLGRLERPVSNYLLGRDGADIHSAVFTARPAVGEPRRFELATALAEPDSAPLTAAVDVVVPLVSDLETVRCCLESLGANPQQTPNGVICVGTSETGEEVRSYIEGLAAAGQVSFIAGDGVGYTDAANLGLLLNPDRDAVLLDDTVEVSGRWLDRLRRAAGSAAEVATASPFSGNGIYCAYPRLDRLNPVPAGESVASLDRLFKEAAAGGALEIPMAPGLCTYIRRSALERVGYLDSLHFGHGYGAVTDFSLRAMLKGYRHLLAGVYVASSRNWHDGGDRERQRQDARQMRLRHPELGKMIREACGADPALGWRRRVDLARIAGSERQRLLMVTHALGGQVERQVRLTARLLEPQLEVLTLYPGLAGVVMVRWERAGEEFHAGFPLPAETPQLEAFLKGLELARIHYHHLAGLPESVARLPDVLGVPYDFTVHDYYTICPRFDLVRLDGAYCGEPGLPACNGCRAEAPVASYEDIRHWRQRHAAFLAAAARVFVPSRDALAKLGGYFPEAPLAYLPAPDDGSGSPEPIREVKVAVPAFELPDAARFLLEDCARDAEARGLPLFFTVLGREVAPPVSSLRYTGPVAASDMVRAIGRERADAIFFPAAGPEVEAEALPAALSSGLPVLAPRLGIYEEALEGRPGAELLEPGAPASAFNDRIMEMTAARTASAHED